MKDFPALDIRSGEPDLLYAILDDFSPTAVEETDDGLRAFFASAAARDAALGALLSRYDARAVDVPDDDWARRSQQNLQPITVGRITVFPSRESLATQLTSTSHLTATHHLAVTNHLTATNPQSPVPNHYSVVIVIHPSMGFGTGHHATTRLCLMALQDLDLAGKTVLDVGTGSGVLAIAADRLGAARAVGIDVDPDAIQSAEENLALNPDVGRVTFQVGDVSSSTLPQADVVTANLTGALLIRSARTLLAAAGADSTLILSGLMRDERDDVCRAFGAALVVWERTEDEWVGLVVKKQ